MPDITFVIPFTPAHASLLPRAVASVLAQTVACDLIAVDDSALTGAGAARNRGLAHVTSNFVSFLDADDWLLPTFAERMLACWRGDRYLYCDYFVDGVATAMPDCMSFDRRWHGITTLIPTTWAQAVGGFDETLTGGEDTEFALKLCASGHGGQRVPEALFHYSNDGERAKRFVESVAYPILFKRLRSEYEGKLMACCGDSVPNDNSPLGEPQLGDVLVQAQWGGNRSERGKATGRLYARTSHPHTLWIAPADLAQDEALSKARNLPRLFRKVETEPVIPPAIARQPLTPPTPDVLIGAAQIAAFLAGQPLPPASVPEPLAEPAPQVGRLLELYDKADGAMKYVAAMDGEPSVALSPVEAEALMDWQPITVKETASEPPKAPARSQRSPNGTRKPRARRQSAKGKSS